MIPKLRNAWVNLNTTYSSRQACSPPRQVMGTWAGIYQSWHLRWEAGAREEPVLCLPELSQKQATDRGPLPPFLNSIVYLQEEPVLCLRKLSRKRVKNRGPLSSFF